MARLVDVDDVLDLFGCSDEDIYGKYTIEDALYDGSLKTTEVVRCKDCAFWDTDFPELPKRCMVIHGAMRGLGESPDDFCSRGERK